MNQQSTIKDQQSIRPSSRGSDILRVLQTKRETKAFYNRIAKVYDLLAEHSEQPMREVALKMLAPAPGERLLEIGFGTGHVLVELAKAVGSTGQVFGIDLSEKMLAQARELLERENLTDRVTLDCGDAADLPYPSDSLDGVFMCFTLELFDTPEIPRVLAQCHRVLRPGGRIVAAAVSKRVEHGLVLRAFEWTHRHFPNLLDCRPIYARRALEAAGFVIEDSRVESMWVPVEIVRGRKSTRCRESAESGGTAQLVGPCLQGGAPRPGKIRPILRQAQEGRYAWACHPRASG